MYHRHTLLLILFLVAACDSNDPGSSDIQVTGDLTSSFDVNASFQPNRADYTEPFTSTDLRLTHLRDSGTSHALSLTISGALQPGSYLFYTGGSASARGSYTTYDDPATLRTFDARDGAIVVTRVSDSRLEGTFRFNAVEIGAQGTARRIEVSGTFSARRVQPQAAR